MPIFEDLRPRGQGLDLRGQGQGLQNVSSRTPPLVKMHVDLWKCGPRTLLYRRIRALKSEKCNKTLISMQVYGF